ncbi:MAG: hypothetical protein J6A20_04625 [Muribaculaceae bacterium]|nr:hypothetical protein [Muribaculaceae bacterium]
MLACAALTLSASATVLWVGSCGYAIYTVGEDYFESEDQEDGTAEEAAARYYEELNETYCGEKSDRYTIYP